MATESNKRQSFHDVALDFPEVAANSLESLTAAAPNAALGQACLVVPPAAMLTEGVAAQGTLTIAEPVTDGDEFTIDSTVYTLLDTPAAAYDIAIGADEAATKVNIVAAINASGTPGTEYFAGTLIHPTVSAAAFVGDDCVLTAKSVGTAGNSIATTETGQGFTHASNVFDDTTLGTTTLGVAQVASNLIYDGVVTAANVVTVRAINVTAAAIDAVSGVFRIVLWN